MDFETFSKIRKNNPKAFTVLADSHLKKAWFVSYYLTKNFCRGAPLLIKAWKISFDETAEMSSAPREDFREIMYGNMLRLYLEGCEEDADFSDLPEPKVAEKYRRFTDEIKSLPDEFRALHLFNNYGNLGTLAISEITGLTNDEVKKKLNEASEFIREKNKGADRDKFAKTVMLSTEFRNPSDSGFSEIVIPDYLMNALAHEINVSITKSATQNRKEQNQMASKNNQKTQVGNKSNAKKKARRNKIIAMSAVALVVIILGVIFVPKLLNNNTATPTSITTYNVEAVTYGDVDTTISGSGTLTPITKETLTLKPDELTKIEDEEAEDATDDEISEGSYRIIELNLVAGELTEEDSVMAVLIDASGVKYEYAAPYEMVVLDMTLEVGDDLTPGATIATVMGTDGFTMGIAVDELDISTVKVGQEVSFTINAVDGDYTGEITNVSYSGSSSGGNTAYQITAQVDYVEGVYPGMTASAEIVIESSGDGLLVPVSAVRTSGDDSYIYLAPSGATEGKEYAEDELDASSLTKVYVETGMSDGSYILIETDELSEGDLIVIVTLTSTQTGSSGDGGDGFGGFGGGGGRPGGMDFGDFDFGDFDPGNMPSGGFPGGGGFPGMGG